MDSPTVKRYRLAVRDWLAALESERHLRPIRRRLPRVVRTEKKMEGIAARLPAPTERRVHTEELLRAGAPPVGRELYEMAMAENRRGRRVN